MGVPLINQVATHQFLRPTASHISWVAAFTLAAETCARRPPSIFFFSIVSNLFRSEPLVLKEWFVSDFFVAPNQKSQQCLPYSLAFLCIQGGMGSRSGILDIGVTHQKRTLKRSVSLRNVQSTRNGGWRNIPIDPVPPVRPNLAVERDQPVQSGNIFGCMWDGIRYGMKRESTI